MKLLPVLLLLMSATLSGCNIDKCEGVPSASEAGLSIVLLNASGTNYLFTPPTVYNRDSVRVSDEQGQVVLATPTTAAREHIGFRLFESGQLPASGKPVTRRFLLYLKHTDQDTIRVECELAKTDCTNPYLRKVVVYYNDSKVHEGSGYTPELIIRKQ